MLILDYCLLLMGGLSQVDLLLVGRFHLDIIVLIGILYVLDFDTTLHLHLKITAK